MTDSDTPADVIARTALHLAVYSSRETELELARRVAGKALDYRSALYDVLRMVQSRGDIGLGEALLDLLERKGIK